MHLKTSISIPQFNIDVTLAYMCKLCPGMKILNILTHISMPKGSGPVGTGIQSGGGFFPETMFA